MAGQGTLSAGNSFRFDHNESNRSLMTPSGSLYGSLFNLSDDPGIYISSVALTIMISAIAMIGIILMAVTITLAVMLMSCEQGSPMELNSIRSRKPDECLSFVLNAELNNLQGLKLPENCEAYLNAGQYKNDVAVALSGARQYLKNHNPQDDGRDVVVMDVDGTVLSSLPYYEKYHQRVKLNGNILDDLVNESNVLAFKPMLDFYKDIQSAKWNVIFLSERLEHQRNKTIQNLLFAGYENWLMLILRSTNESNLPCEIYKAKKRLEVEKQGYRIWSAFGDEWSDILGPATGNKTFKLPNPVYYRYTHTLASV